MRAFAFYFIVYLFAAVSTQSALAQDRTSEVRTARQAPDVRGMDMPGMNHEQDPKKKDSVMNMQPQSLIESIEQHATGGTDAQPLSVGTEMLMTQRSGWTLMFHGDAFLVDTQQGGPRGRDRFFSTNWIMPMAQRKLAGGTLTLRTMLSFEPATITRRQYPELFQQGETAYGQPIADGQHPHDLFMELAVLYDRRLAEKTLLSFYYAPMGDPAMGPVAYPHRVSASENPLAPLGHHLQDSTHIVSNVVTVGLTYGMGRIEASGFHGREPDEHRWNIDPGKIDSWATRLTLAPGANWTLQYSIAQMHSPEAAAPDEDLRRMTASVMYNRLLHSGNWASLLLWGRNQSLTDGNIGNGYLLESTLMFLSRNAIWGRMENVDRTNELLLNGESLPPGFVEKYFTRVQAYTAGYDREIGHIPHLSTALGGQVTWYGAPEVLRGSYGDHPVSAVVFLRVRVR